jgi:hypothetical protein
MHMSCNSRIICAYDIAPSFRARAITDGKPIAMIALMLPISARTLFLSTAFLSGVADHARTQPQSSGTPRIKLGVVWPAAWQRDSTNTSSIRGMMFGIEEGQRTAAMFGWELVVERSPDSLSALSALSALARSGATAVVGDFSDLNNTGGPTSATSLVLDIGRSAAATARGCRDSRFRIAPSKATSLPAWHRSLERYGAAQLNERFRKRFETAMDDRAWTAWMAVKILVDAALKSGASDARALETYLLHSGRFDGHKGVPLSFNATTRELVQPVVAIAEDGEPELVSGEQRVATTGEAGATCPGE